MTHCPHTGRVQAYLGGDLPEAEARAFREHLAGCAACAAETALYARVFEALDRAPLAEPSVGLTERVLVRVLPSQVRRRRWMRSLGWGYAAALAASLAGIAVWVAQPEGQGVLSALSAAASKRLLEATIFVVQSLSFALLNLSAAWKALALGIDRFAPFARALGSLFGQSGVLWTFAAAAAACVALLWWMRPRADATPKEIRHVVLGF